MDTTQEFLVPASSLAPDEEALVLFPYEAPARNDLAVRQKREKPSPEPFIWPLDATTGQMNTGPVTAEQGSTWSYNPRVTNHVEQSIVREAIAQQSPEQVGLNAQVLDAVLFPERQPIFLEPVTTPLLPVWWPSLVELNVVQRAKFVRFVAAIYHLEHDVTALACLLENHDPVLRAAAVRKLEALTGSRVPAPGEVGTEEMGMWIKFQAAQIDPKPVNRWPAVPKDLRLSPDSFSPALLQALEQNDADAFAREFARWMEAGVRRDRSIWLADSLDRQVAEDNALSEQSSSCPPAPRLRPELVLNPALPAFTRMQGIAWLAQLIHFDRFAKERAAATELIPNQGEIDNFRSPESGPSMAMLNAKLFPRKGGADVETLRRAAFWEISGLFNQFPDPGRDAMHRLAEQGVEEVLRFPNWPPPP